MAIAGRGAIIIMSDSESNKLNLNKNCIKDYFYNGGLNCAESTIRLVDSLGKYEMPAELIKTMSGFGGGMQRGLTCGAVAAGVALLGLYTGRTKPTESREPTVEAVKIYLEEFEKRFGSLICEQLKADFRSKTDEMYDHCTQFVIGSAEIAAKILDEKLKK